MPRFGDALGARPLAISRSAALASRWGASRRHGIAGPAPLLRLPLCPAVGSTRCIGGDCPRPLFSSRIRVRARAAAGRGISKSSYQNPRGAQEISGLWPAGRGFERRSKRAIYLYCCHSRFRHSLSHSQRFSTRWRLLSIHSGQGLRPSMECRSGRGLRRPWVRRPGVEVLPDRQTNLTDPASQLMRKSQAHKYCRAHCAQALPVSRPPPHQQQ